MVGMEERSEGGRNGGGRGGGEGEGGRNGRETTSTWRVSHVEFHHVLAQATPTTASEPGYIERVPRGTGGGRGRCEAPGRVGEVGLASERRRRGIGAKRWSVQPLVAAERCCAVCLPLSLLAHNAAKHWLRRKLGNGTKITLATPGEQQFVICLRSAAIVRRNRKRCVLSWVTMIATRSRRTALVNDVIGALHNRELRTGLLGGERGCQRDVLRLLINGV